MDETDLLTSDQMTAQKVTSGKFLTIQACGVRFAPTHIRFMASLEANIKEREVKGTRRKRTQEDE
jgi:hypothetical protein